MSQSAIIAAGPLMSAAKLKEWVRIAQPNARLTYGEGYNSAQSCSREVCALVGALAEKGWLTPHRIKSAAGLLPLHIVQRTRRPWKNGEAL